jgi:hypothetical protein
MVTQQIQIKFKNWFIRLFYKNKNRNPLDPGLSEVLRNFEVKPLTIITKNETHYL